MHMSSYSPLFTECTVSLRLPNNRCWLLVQIHVSLLHLHRNRSYCRRLFSHLLILPLALWQCRVRVISFLVSPWWHWLHWFSKQDRVLYWILFWVLIVKKLSGYFVVFLKVISEFSSLESRLANLIIAIMRHRLLLRTHVPFKIFTNQNKAPTSAVSCFTVFLTVNTSSMYLASFLWVASIRTLSCRIKLSALLWGYSSLSHPNIWCLGAGLLLRSVGEW